MVDDDCDDSLADDKDCDGIPYEQDCDDFESNVSQYDENGECTLANEKNDHFYLPMILAQTNNTCSTGKVRKIHM